MPFDDPRTLDVFALFRDASMFESRRAWGASGFRVVNPPSAGKVMVAQHPSVKGLLFKKYTDEVSQGEQTQNYETRVQGSYELRAFVESRHLSRVVVPRKWMLKLPHIFGRHAAHVLVVEQIDLFADDQSKTAYRNIDPGVLSELCTVLFRYRGMDSSTKNIPFTVDGRIAFIDTEHWNRKSRKPYLRHLGELLSTTSRRHARKLFARLEDDARDFSDEEDTSSSSSSS